MVRVTQVEAGSIAEAAGIRAGDLLLEINGHGIRDVLDYRFYLAEESIRLTVHRDGKDVTVQFRKSEYDDIGLEFETPLMDRKRSCANGCIFCFIDQLPGGMRESLYFKDDDDRLSFLHGNYVTLTNLTDADVERLITMRISPINVSVHTTNPELRVRMMKNRRAGEVLKYLGKLADAGIELCAQIVLCKGINDGEELARTMRDLAGYFPALRSCSVVPVGLTKFREKLYPLELFSPDECADVIRQVNAYGDGCFEKYGTRLFYCADEFYIRAGLPLPESSYYEEYPQIENGVGMLTSLREEFEAEAAFLGEDLARFREKYPQGRTVSVATGAAAYADISVLCRELTDRVPGLTVNVCEIKNRFFGETVTVAGLLTGQDVRDQLRGKPLGEELLFPAAMLKADEEIFLDDLTPADLAAALGVGVRAVENDGAALLHALLGV